ncbi:hypothetical protein LguiA_000479 [Lonicera macranthoides]
MSSSPRPHILVFPYPAQGHMLPILDLTHQLALRGLTITILITPKNLPILTPLLSTHPSTIHTLIFPFPHHPSLPSTVENVKDIGNSANVLIINALGKLHLHIIQWFMSHPKPPVALLSDFFLGWTQHLAHQLSIPRICFYSSGPFLSSVLGFLWDHINGLPSDTCLIHFTDLPRSPSFPTDHLPSVFRRYNESDPDWEFVKDSFIANNSSWGSLFNTFYALEGEFLDYSTKTTGNSRVFGVGPLSLLGGSDNMGRGKTDSDSRDLGVLTWLDQFPHGSVVYVCFGSQKMLKTAQIEALAHGLERSGTPFVWVIKPATSEQVRDGYGSVPDGFEERVLGRGLVIKGWAPQVSILAHGAVGGFLSHCGWNSVLEGIVGGVMILGWPMEADQFVNAKLLVEYMGAAIQVCEGADTVPDPDELGRVIGESMNGEVVEKVRAKELRDRALEAVKEGGSSSRDLEALVRELNQLQLKIV